MFIQLFGIIFLGVILGKIYSATKAAASIAKTLTVTFVTKKEGDAQVRIAILVMLIIAAAMTMGGIDGFVLTFTTFPIAFVIAEMVDIPRRFIPPMLMLNCAFMACPGAPQVDNTVMVGTLILMGRYIDKKDGSIAKAILGTLNMGADGYPHALATVATPSGLASVVTTTAAFGIIVGWLSSLNINPIMLGLLTTCIIVALTSAPPVALAVGLPIVVGICAQKGIDLNPAALGRVSALAATTFETLPVNGMCVLTIGLSRSTYKKSYPIMFLNTLVYTLIGSIVAALICVAAPGVVF